MASCTFEDVFFQFYIKANAYNLLELTEMQVNDFLCGWLHSAAAKPYVRKLFSSFNFDDEVHEIEFEMKYSVDDFTDLDFTLDVLSIGMIIEWLRPYVNNSNNLSQVYGSSSEKYYSQAAHLAELRNTAAAAKKEQRQIISDRGSAWNSYLSGDN